MDFCYIGAGRVSQVVILYSNVSIKSSLGRLRNWSLNEWSYYRGGPFSRFYFSFFLKVRKSAESWIPFEETCRVIGAIVRKILQKFLGRDFLLLIMLESFTSSVFIKMKR